MLVLVLYADKFKLERYSRKYNQRVQADHVQLIILYDAFIWNKHYISYLLYNH